MKKEYIHEEKNKKLIVSFSPENVEEVNDWYAIHYVKSLEKHEEMILNLLKHVARDMVFLISCYKVHKNFNMLEKRKGIAGVYSKAGKQYQSSHEKIIEKADGDNMYSVLKVDSSSISSLFVSQIPSLLCVAKKAVTENELLDFSSKFDFETLTKKLLEENDLIIRFHDIGCDGNSIIIYSDNLFFDLGVIK